MTRTERTIVSHWRGLVTLCAIVALFGIAWATWHRVDADRAAADRNYAEAMEEADLRGEALSMLAGDVRALRAQVEASGETPVAPDPSRAVEDLPDRVQVPVPIPGPPGPRGPAGRSCPDGYSWQAPSYDPDALVCRRDGAPEPGGSGNGQGGGPQAEGALDPRRIEYT